MDSSQTLRKSAFTGTLVVLALLLWSTTAVQAADDGRYTQLQVLLPGQEAAPGTTSGVIGAPEAQAAGVPFQVRIRACDQDWDLVTGVHNPLNFSSSDGTANLPPNTPLTTGEVTTWVTLNSLGNYTLTVRDITGTQQISATSLAIPVEAAATYSDRLMVSQIPVNQVAGQAMVLRIEARRADGSLDTGSHGTVALHQVTSLGQGVMTPDTVDLTAGVWEGAVTFLLADPQSTPDGAARLNVSFADGGLQGWSNFFNVAPGPYDRLVAITPGQNWTPWIVEGLNGTPERQWADGPFPVDVYATDMYWNRVDVTDQVKLESGDSEADTPQYGALVGGHHRFYVNLRTPGEWFLAASDADQPEIGSMVTADVPVYYSHLQVLLPGENPAPGSATGRTGQPLPQVAGIPFPVRIRACNANFETVPSDRVVARLTSTDHTATLPVPEPMQNGERVVEVIFNSSGTFTLTAEDISGPEYYSVTTAAVPVSGSTGYVTELEIETIDTYQTAGQPVITTIRARDAAGDQVHTFNGVVNLEQWLGNEVGTLEPGEITLNQGQWTGVVTFHRADQTAPDGQPGNVRLTAYSQTDPAVFGASNFFQVAPGNLNKLLVLLPGQTRNPAMAQGLVGGPATQAAGLAFQAEIFAVDAYWNRVAVTHTVEITSEDPHASTPVQALLQAGYATVPVTFGSVGNWTLTASDLTQDWVLPMTTTPISVLSSTPEFVIDPVEGPVTAGEPVMVTIRTYTPEEELMDAYNGYAMLAAESGPQTIVPSSIQFTGGVWSGLVTFYGASPEMAFSCIDFASPPNIGASDVFEVQPGAFAGLQVLLPGQENVGGRNPGFSGFPLPQEAGQPFPLVVRAVDSWWNPVPDVAVGIDLTLTDAFALVPENNHLTDGLVTLESTFLRAGHHTVTAYCDGAEVDSHTSVEFMVQPGPYARILALAPGEEPLAGSELGKVGLAVDQSISYSFPLQVQATDNWWNPVTEPQDLIELVCTDTMAEVPETFSLAHGSAQIEVRLATAGYQLMTLNNLTNPAIPAAHTQMRAIESGFHIEAEIHPAEVIAGQPFTLSVRVVNDAGAVMQDMNGFVDVAVIHAISGEPGSGELSTTSFQFHQGVRSINQTYTRSEPILLVLTSPLGEGPGMTGALNVVPGPPASLDFHETSNWVAGLNTTDINAKVADELGNGVPGVNVEFALTGGLGFLEVLQPVTDQEGLAKARFTGASTPGAGFVQVAAANFLASMEIVTSLLDPGSSGGTISNYPNPFHPGDAGTVLTYVLSRDAAVTMRLFTLTGTLVFERNYPAGDIGGSQGINEVPWDGRNGDGSYVASGGYILYVEAERQGETIHKMRRRIGVVR
nr:hypothetical protein [Candidatus Krumholzibacteria bacterium]